MGRAIGIFAAGILLSASLCGADAARCRLSRGLYEDRLTIVQKQGPADTVASGALLDPGNVTATPAGRLASIDQEYRQFLKELSAALQSKDAGAVTACCENAAGDRAGALFCQLSTYLNGSRKESSGFLELFPSSRKEIAMLWDLDRIAGDSAKEFYPPKGPSYSLIDELFLLVMDERDTAIVKYFNLTSHATGDEAKYMDDRIKIFLKEAPAAVVNQWLLLRRYRSKLKSAAQSLIAASSPAEMQKVVRAVHTFCDKSNPDCPDIFKLYAGK
jgi:hypothetical protein